MIDYDLFRFATAPRTGSAWVVSAAALAGLGERQRAKVHIPHEPAVNSFCISLVREPCEWLASYWATIKGGLVGVREVDVFSPFCREKSFDEFIRGYLHTIPGQVGKMFNSYHADSYMRTCDLPWAFVEVLQAMKVPKPLRDRVLSLGKVNASKRRPDWQPSLYRQVKLAEAEMIEEFDF